MAYGNGLVGVLLLGLGTLTTAQYGPGGRPGPRGRPGDDDDDGPGGANGPGSYNSFGPGSQYGATGGAGGPFSYANFMTEGQKILIAHAVLASLAFVLLFPTGSILIRLASFRGLWLIHGLFQLFAYAIYTAAFGIGVYIVTHVPVSLIDRYHPIIGIICFVLLFFQPILGLIHHFKFKRLQRRTFWSYAHLWLGRIVITLGMINGGLGMLLATETGFYRPTRGQMIAYGVVAAFMWLAWVAASVVGERRRKRSQMVYYRDDGVDGRGVKREYA